MESEPDWKAEALAWREFAADAARTAGGTLSWFGYEFPGSDGMDRFGGAAPSRSDLRQIEVDLRWIEHEYRRIRALNERAAAAPETP